MPAVTAPAFAASSFHERDAYVKLYYASTSMMEKHFFVYVLASRRNGTLYIGVTSDILRRVWEHRSKAVPGFTATYGVTRLVYFEVHENAESAILREKRMKKWRRSWKVDLIESTNPTWRDLYAEIA